MDNQPDETSDVSDLLADETEEEKQFHLHVSHQNTPVHGAPHAGMVHSATTDTLDSVYLEPAALDPDLDSGEINLDDPAETAVMAITDTDIKEETKNPGVPADTATVLPSADVEGSQHEANDTQFFFEDNDEKALSSPPSLSKYFGKNEESDPFAGIVNIDEVVEGNDKQPKEQEQAEETINLEDDIEPVEGMLDLNLDDTKDDEGDITEDTSIDNANNNFISNGDPAVETVDFDLTLDEIEKVESPVNIEEKDTFESFTADLADTETLDALGMSPAAPSYMTDRNIKDYFRQTSQADSVASLKLGRQVSQSSLKSAGSVEQNSVVVGSLKSEESESPRDAAVITESAIQPATTATTEVAHTQVAQTQVTAEPRKWEEHKEATPSHQPMFPPSTTLSPGESPVHQSSFNAGTSQRQASVSSIPEEQQNVQKSPPASFPPTPEHQLAAFQTFKDSVSGEDPFVIGLEMSDSDRQHDAWIPSEATKNILITMATHLPGTYTPDKELLCQPLLVITEPQGDPVRDLVYRYMGEQEALKRQVLTADRVTQDFDGVQQLMKAGCFRAAIDLTGKLLADMGQGIESETPVTHSPDSLQLWYCRFSLFMKLRLYSIIESECMAFKNMDTPDIYYEFYPQLYRGKKGSMVPFGFRLVHAELPHHLGRSQEALDRLFYMLALSQKIMKNLNDGLCEDGSAVTISAESRKVSQELWEEREKQVFYSIANILVSLRDYDAALSVYDTLMEKDGGHKKELLSGMGRIHLQIGNFTKASEYFKLVNEDQKADDARATGTLLMNRGFEAMCQNNFQEAYTNFKSAVQADPTNTSAINNMAVCCLYLGRLKDALKTLESLVHGNPARNLHEGVLFNLCTLYELESSRALHKKQALLDLVSKHKGDGFPVICLKMQ